VWIVAGLGNPGTQYRGNRHNVGFMVADLLAERAKAAAFKEKFSGAFVKTEIAGREAVLLKPMTYMNLSGESVQKAMAFFKTSREELVVVHDELDLTFGTVRVKQGGGAAGHNGIKSLIQHVGPDFVRVRVGIGRPRSGSTEGYVLSDFDSMERAELPDVVARAAKAVETIAQKGVTAAMNEVNAREK